VAGMRVEIQMCLLISQAKQMKTIKIMLTFIARKSFSSSRTYIIIYSTIMIMKDFRGTLNLRAFIAFSLEGKCTATPEPVKPLITLSSVDLISLSLADTCTEASEQMIYSFTFCSKLLVRLPSRGKQLSPLESSVNLVLRRLASLQKGLEDAM
jgi:hypothetical protein